VKGLQNLRGVTRGVVTLRDCPDLETLDGPAKDLEAEDCPRLKHAWLGTQSRRVSLKRCGELKSICPWNGEYSENPSFGSEWIYELEDLKVEDCPQFRSLPSRLRIQKGLTLQGVGQVDDWPWDFRVGETFLVAECPKLESLPALEIGGSLIVTGASGLRKLSPGTVIGKHLDLRACELLEDFPRRVKVGGNIYLPEHLNHRRRHLVSDPLEACELLEVPQPDLYEELRALLMVLRFPALIPSRERLADRELADEILARYRVRVAQEPRFEALLLWTASEVWQDMAGEVWAETSQWVGLSENASDEDLPMAWLLGLVRE
jgi:hypothetical protein